MLPSSLLTRLLNTLTATTALLVGFAALPPALAITNNELLPASLVGKTLQFTTTPGIPNPIDSIASYTLQFSSATSFVRTIPAGSSSGIYAVVDSNVSPFTGSQNTVMQLISGWPGTGVTGVSLVLTHVGGVGSFTVVDSGNPSRTSGGTFTVNGSPDGSGGGAVPVITSPTTASATIGSPFTYQIVATNSPAFYILIGQAPWLNLVNSTGLLSGTPPAGAITTTVTLNAVNSSGTGSQLLTITIGGTGSVSPPIITLAPAPSPTVVEGESVTFTVTATGTGLSYQWLFNNNPIGGATSPTLTLSDLSATSAGSYSVRITNAGGSITSGPSLLTVSPVSRPTFLSNLSVRARAGGGSETLIVGVTIGGGAGSSTKSMLIRGVGPTLGTLGVGGVLADPILSVVNGSTTIASNDDWNNDATVASTSTAVGAFPLDAGSRDSAYFGSNFGAGGYTVQLSGKRGATGNALIELYDTAPTATVTATTARFTNMSARTFGGTGNETLIVGFNLAGTGTRRLIVRAVGPGLTTFGVSEAMPDPKLELYRGTEKIGENDDWEAGTLAAQQSVGAFGLTSGSRDAVLVTTQAPGSYTVLVTGGSTGVVLVEVYEAP